LRFRECFDCDIFTYCPSDPVIEASRNIKFGPFNYKFPNAKILFKKANFIEKENNYTKIYDFSDNNNEKKHFSLMEKGEFKEIKLLLNDIKEENEYIYDNYNKEYSDLLLEQEQINNNNQSENYSQDSFFNEDQEIIVSDIIEINNIKKEQELEERFDKGKFLI
jgi:hypothetical protein